MLTAAAMHAPETPEATEVAERRATTITLYGVLNPNSEGEPGGYQFIYKRSSSSCQGEKETPEEPSFGGAHETVAASVSELLPGTTYTYCVRALNSLDESTLSAPLTFTTAIPPEQPLDEPATEVTATAATLHGVLNPSHTGEAGGYKFVYRASADECEGEGEKSVAEGTPSDGHSPEPVQARATGLLPDTEYAFCLGAQNSVGEEVRGEPVETFTTPTAVPAISEEASTAIATTTATIAAQINPGGEPTTYFVEYGESIAYGSSTPTVSAGAGANPEAVQVGLTGLTPSSTYHARIVASNALGATDGEDLTFTTAAAGSGSSALPDGRAYELVSGDNGLEVYSPSLGLGSEEQSQISSDRNFRAAASGEAVTYLSEPPPSGGSGSQGLGEQFLAKRTPQGWTSADIVPADASGIAKYISFSAELTTAIFDTEFEDAAGKLPEAESGSCDPFFARDGDGSLHAFFTQPQTSIECGNTGNDDQASYAGASADGSHLLFETQAALTPEAEKASVEFGYNLYDSIAGQLQLVNVLPGNNPAPDPDATFGGPHGVIGRAGNPAGFSNAISSDGSRVFWTDLNTGRIYVRENGSTTVPVSPGAAEYWTATPDGRYAFYTEGTGTASTLWRFNVTKFNESTAPEAQALAEAREELTAPGGGVEGVVGANETGTDGSYVYFVASGVLAANRNSSGDEAHEGAPNLYVLSGDETRFIASLVPGDNEIGPRLSGDGQLSGAWQHNPGDKTSEVTPDGRTIGFLSHAQLTSYDNRGYLEVYVYNVESSQLLCASCDPTGSPPVNVGSSEGARVPTTNPGGVGSTYQERWISEDGSRVFFDSTDPLVPQVNDGKLNVYEWELDGAGSCRQSPACIYLLSGGSSPDSSFFVDASANGDDVFFTSREDFVGQAHGQAQKLYDARIGGGVPEATTACTGTGCQGVPPASPQFATPPSVTFAGIGNYPPAPPAKPKATETRAERLAAALKQCRTKHKRDARRACEAQARKRYGPPHKPKKPSRKRTKSSHKREGKS